jgi:hypothetical protein
VTSDEPSAPRPARSWRTADFPVAVLLAGIVVVVAATLGLASIGSAVGVVAIAVLLAGVIVLFWYWGREQLRESGVGGRSGQSGAAGER